MVIRESALHEINHRQPAKRLAPTGDRPLNHRGRFSPDGGYSGRQGPGRAGQRAVDRRGAGGDLGVQQDEIQPGCDSGLREGGPLWISGRRPYAGHDRLVYAASNPPDARNGQTSKRPPCRRPRGVEATAGGRAVIGAVMLPADAWESSAREDAKPYSMTRDHRAPSDRCWCSYPAAPVFRVGSGVFVTLDTLRVPRSSGSGAPLRPTKSRDFFPLQQDAASACVCAASCLPTTRPRALSIRVPATDPRAGAEHRTGQTPLYARPSRAPSGARAVLCATRERQSIEGINRTKAPKANRDNRDR